MLVQLFYKAGPYHVTTDLFLGIRVNLVLWKFVLGNIDKVRTIIVGWARTGSR